MKPPTETATYVVDTDLLTDALVTTDLESYRRQWRVSVNTVPSGVSMAGQTSPKMPALQFHDFFGTVVATLMAPAGTIMGGASARNCFSETPNICKVDPGSYSTGMS